MSQYTAVLDIGSSKIICLLCSPDGKDGILVHGAGIREYKGYRRGKIEDEQQFADSIVDALAAAEGEARRRVREISVGVPAPFTKLVLHEGEVTPRGRGNRITHRDIDELLNASLDFHPPEGYELIHSTPVEFTVDGAVHADMPIGLTARSLKATVSHLYVEEHFKRLVSDALLRVGLDADMYIAVPLSEGIFVIPEEERAYPAVLLDVGATHTDVCVVHNSALIAMRTIEIGGNHFSSDISYGLGLAKPVAETVKRRYVYSLDYQDSIDIIRIPGGGVMNVDHAAIQYIIEERTKELAGLILEAIKDMGVTVDESLPLYMTGGGFTLMRGGCEYMERRIGAPIQVRMPWMPRLSSPNYASAFSVVDFVLHVMDEDNAGRTGNGSQEGKLFKKIKDFFVK